MKRFISDALISIISSMLPILVIQLILFPKISNEIGQALFGNLVFIFSVLTVISFPIGNSLNNIRMLAENKNDKDPRDFQVLIIFLLLWGMILLAIVSVFSVTIREFSNIAYLFIAINILKEYYVVEFRIKLDFKSILVSNIFLVVGYVLGYFYFLKSGNWIHVFIVGLVFNIVFIISQTSYYKIPIKITNSIRKTTKDFSFLYSSNILRNVLVHADKILIFPLLGAINTAIYYSATLVGKILSMLVGPINNVVLSYLIKKESINKKEFNVVLITSMIISIIFYFILLRIGGFILLVLYPSWADVASVILKYTIAAAVFNTVSSLITSYNIRFNNLKWQLIISSSNVLLYTALTIPISSFYGIKGFAIVVMIINAINLIVNIILLKRAIK